MTRHKAARLAAAFMKAIETQINMALQIDPSDTGGALVARLAEDARKELEDALVAAEGE